MLVKDKKSGEVVGMHYGPAMEAVQAGTHEIVNETAEAPASTEPAPPAADAPAHEPEVTGEILSPPTPNLGDDADDKPKPRSAKA